MAKIIENEKSAIIRTVAYNKIVDAESTVLFHDLVMNFTFFIGRVDDPLQSRAYLGWNLKTSFWHALMLLPNMPTNAGIT